MNRFTALFALTACTACFSPEPIAAEPDGSSGEVRPDATGEEAQEESSTDGGEVGGGLGPTTGFADGTESGAEVPPDEPGTSSSSSGGDGESGGESIGKSELCGYAFRFVDGECRSGEETFCVPDDAAEEMQVACEACTGVPCERQACSLGALGVPGDVWTPIIEGGGHIESPMGFVDAPISALGEQWERGAILADACSRTQIGQVEF